MGAKIDEAVKKESALNSAMAKFKQLDLKNTETSDEGLSTVHQNFITYVQWECLVFLFVFACYLLFVITVVK